MFLSKRWRGPRAGGHRELAGFYLRCVQVVHMTYILHDNSFVTDGFVVFVLRYILVYSVYFVKKYTQNVSSMNAVP